MVFGLPTPGLWKMGSEDTISIDIYSWTAGISASAKVIARVPFDAKDAGRSRADACLIRAAPELLAALIRCEEILGCICEALCPDNPPPTGVEVLGAARAAIESAKGGAL